MSRDNRSNTSGSGYGAGYPRYQDSRDIRDPCEERILRDLDVANDPYSPLRRQQSAGRFREEQRGRRREPQPIFTVRAPSEERRRSLPPEERRSSYPSFRRDSSKPHSRPRASKRTVSGFQDEFGDLPPPTTPNQRLRYASPGPFNDPFNRRDTSAAPPYGGFTPPRNPYGPGGDIHDRERSRGRRSQSRDQDRRRVDEKEPSRRQHYRARVGEEWGLAEYEAYRSRRRNESRMRRN